MNFDFLGEMLGNPVYWVMGVGVVVVCGVVAYMLAQK